mgnify:CR=1 FL=1
MFYFFLQAEEGIRCEWVTGVQTCALPIFFNRLAVESAGEKQIELPGFGPIFLKRDGKDVERNVRFSLTKFEGPNDGKTVNKHAFDNAWSRIKTQKLQKTST